MKKELYKRKLGFTLMELLAVILILSVIILLAVPNTIKIWNNAQKDAFVDEARNIYNSVAPSYNNDFLTDSVKVRRYCEGNDTDLRILKIKKDDKIKYDILLDEQGNITEFKITNGKFIISLPNDDSFVYVSDIVREIITDEEIEINCSIT